MTSKLTKYTDVQPPLPQRPDLKRLYKAYPYPAGVEAVGRPLSPAHVPCESLQCVIPVVRLMSIACFSLISQSILNPF